MARSCQFILLVLLVFSGMGAAPPATATAPSGPWLAYEYVHGRGYKKITMAFAGDGAVAVHVERNNTDPPIDYTARLTAPELTWFITLVHETDFANPDRLEREAAGGDGGLHTWRTDLNGKKRQATFGRDAAFDDLRGATDRLLIQAECMDKLLREHKSYDLQTALREHRVLQPDVFREPLIKDINEHFEGLADDLGALALITTPEVWGGVLEAALDKATDEPLSPGSTLSRRRIMLQVITDPGFCPDSHKAALIKIYHVQSAIEAAKDTDEARRFVRSFQEREASLVPHVPPG